MDLLDNSDERWAEFGFAILHSQNRLVGGATETTARTHVELAGQIPIREGLIIEHRTSFSPALRAPEDYLLQTSTSLFVQVTSNLMLSGTYELSRTSIPAEDVGPEDRMLTVGVRVEL